MRHQENPKVSGEQHWQTKLGVGEIRRGIHPENPGNQFDNCYIRSTFQNAENTKNYFTSCCVWVWNVVPYFDRRTRIASVCEQSVQVNTCT